METKDLLTIKEAAQILRVTAPTIYQAIEEGRLPAQIVLGRKVVTRADVDAYIKRVRPDGVKPKGRPKAMRQAE